MSILKGKYSPIPSNFSSELSEIINLCLTKNALLRPSTSYLLSLPSVVKLLYKNNNKNNNNNYINKFLDESNRYITNICTNK